MPGKSHKKGASSAAANPDDAAAAPPSTPPRDEGKHSTTPLSTSTALKLSKVKDLASQLPMLTNDNFYSWDVALKNHIYFAEWEDGVIDVDGVWNAWSGMEEADKDYAKQRRTAFAVMRMRVPPSLFHLVEDVRPGDAKGVYSALRTRFCRLTNGAILSLRTQLNEFTMQSSAISRAIYL